MELILHLVVVLADDNLWIFAELLQWFDLIWEHPQIEIGIVQNMGCFNWVVY